jgi:ribosomal protein S18 acetylase RimI-like enzyme
VIEPLGIANADELQQLLERCSDYFEVCENGPTPPDAARTELSTAPPGRSIDDLFVFGIRDGTGQLIGVNIMIRNWPREPEEWWLSGQVIDPAHRNTGIGTSLYREVEAFVLAEGGRVIQMSVIERNTSAERFWRRIGFREIERQDYTAPSGWKTRVIILRRDVSPDASSITIARST